MLPRSKQVSPIEEFSICIVWIFVLALLLEIWKVRIVVDCLVKIMDIFIRKNFLLILKQLMIIF
jgi:hypothetical protein